MKHTLIALPLAAVAFAAPAQAATAYMGGLLGTTPGYSTITGPNGERVNTAPTWLGGDQRVSWNNVSQQSAVDAQIAWLEKHQAPGERNTLWVYSATANSINKVAALRPDLLANTDVIAIAPPRAGSLDYAAVPTPSTFRQYQIIVDGDSVADEDGTNFDTHVNGYRNLNMQTATPISATTLHDTNTERRYYQRPSTTKTSAFNLFDMRTWFKPRTSSSTTAVGRAAPDETQLSESPIAAERPTAAERRAEKKAQVEQRRADRKAEREERQARSSRQHEEPPAAAHASVGADSEGGAE